MSEKRKVKLVGIIACFIFCKMTHLNASFAGTYAKKEEWCKKLSEELKSVDLNRCLNRDWKNAVHSKQGNFIPYLEWSDQSAASKNKKVKKILILGGVHGDEISSVSMVFRWMDFLERTKPDSFLRENQYLFFPLVNPDGFFKSPRTRTNANGVDLNRNFSTSGWSEKAQPYWKKQSKGNARRFPGENASSEIETRLIEKKIAEFKPELIVSVHAPYHLVDHDGPIVFPNVKAPLPVRALGAFPGSLGTYAGRERNIPVVTPELPSATQLPQLKIVEDLFLFIMRADTPK